MNDIYQIFDSIPVIDTKTFRSYINNYIKKFGESDLTRQIIQDRFKKYIDFINSADEFHLYEQKNIFCDMYFHESFDKFLPKLQKLINYYNSFELRNEIIEKLYDNLSEIDNPNVIKNMISNKDNSSLLDIVNNELKIAEKNSKLGIISALENGYALVHKTDNICWGEKEDNISCSLITKDNYNQTWECGKYSLGFVVTDPNEIVAMGCKDLDIGMHDELDEDYLTPYDLIKNTKHHNEVLITARYPSFVICYGNVTEDEKTASESLQIPIFDLFSKSIISSTKEK